MASTTAMKSAQQRLSYAFDLLHFSFPSQISTLPEATQLLSTVMQMLDDEMSSGTTT